MPDNERTDILLQRLGAILIRSFLLGLAFLVLWFLFYLMAPDWMFEMNAKWFTIDKRDFDLINYFGMGFVKISIILFFFFPYLAIEWTLRKRGKNT
jgi:hypothetical protein